MTKTDPTAEPKPATLETTLEAIAAAAAAEKLAGEDAYAKLVQDLAAGKASLTPADVVNLLKRADRVTDHLAADVAHLQTLAPLEAEFARLPALRQAEAAAKKLLESAAAEWELRKAEIDRPLLLAQAKYEAARDATQTCSMLKLRIAELKRQQEARDAKRLGLVKKGSSVAPAVEYVEA